MMRNEPGKHYGACVKTNLGHYRNNTWSAQNNNTSGNGFVNRSQSRLEYLNDLRNGASCSFQNGRQQDSENGVRDMYIHTSKGVETVCLKGSVEKKEGEEVEKKRFARYELLKEKLSNLANKTEHSRPTMLEVERRIESDEDIDRTHLDTNEGTVIENDSNENNNNNDNNTAEEPKVPIKNDEVSYIVEEENERENENQLDQQKEKEEDPIGSSQTKRLHFGKQKEKHVAVNKELQKKNPYNKRHKPRRNHGNKNKKKKSRKNNNRRNNHSSYKRTTNDAHRREVGETSRTNHLSNSSGNPIIDKQESAWEMKRKLLLKKGDMSDIVRKIRDVIDHLREEREASSFVPNANVWSSIVSQKKENSSVDSDSSSDDSTDNEEESDQEVEQYAKECVNENNEKSQKEDNQSSEAKNDETSQKEDNQGNEAKNDERSQKDVYSVKPMDQKESVKSWDINESKRTEFATKLEKLRIQLLNDRKANRKSSSTENVHKNNSDESNEQSTENKKSEETKKGDLDRIDLKESNRSFEIEKEELVSKPIKEVCTQNKENVISNDVKEDSKTNGEHTQDNLCEIEEEENFTRQKQDSDILKHSKKRPYVPESLSHTNSTQFHRKYIKNDETKGTKHDSVDGRMDAVGLNEKCDQRISTVEKDSTTVINIPRKKYNDIRNTEEQGSSYSEREERKVVYKKGSGIEESQGSITNEKQPDRWLDSKNTNDGVKCSKCSRRKESKQNKKKKRICRINHVHIKNINIYINNDKINAELEGVSQNKNEEEINGTMNENRENKNKKKSCTQSEKMESSSNHQNVEMAFHSVNLDKKV